MTIFKDQITHSLNPYVSTKSKTLSICFCEIVLKLNFAIYPALCHLCKSTYELTNIAKFEPLFTSLRQSLTKV